MNSHTLTDFFFYKSRVCGRIYYQKFYELIESQRNLFLKALISTELSNKLNLFYFKDRCFTIHFCISLFDSLKYFLMKILKNKIFNINDIKI